MDKIQELLNRFALPAGERKAEPFGNGHINNTFLVTIDGVKERYILQRINNYVFVRPLEVMENMLHVTEYLQERNREGVTVFLSSHVLNEIQRYCSRAAVIRDGRVIVSDSVDRLARSNARRITLRGQLSRESFPDAKDWKEEDGAVSFLYSGDINQLVRILAGTELQDLTVAEPDLEEIILHYYEKGGEQA